MEQIFCSMHLLLVTFSFAFALIDNLLHESFGHCSVAN